VGFEYLEYCCNNINIPKTAIGGIKIANLDSICRYSMENVCMVTEITKADNIKETVKKIIGIMNGKA
jgi:thiamine monophosphate synthase